MTVDVRNIKAEWLGDRTAFPWSISACSQFWEPCDTLASGRRDILHLELHGISPHTQPSGIPSCKRYRIPSCKKSYIHLRKLYHIYVDTQSCRSSLEPYDTLVH